MISNADVVVIGSGGTAAATAYALSKRGGLSVALLDKHDIGSQTSPRAAGMVSCPRKGDLMTMSEDRDVHRGNRTAARRLKHLP